MHKMDLKNYIEFPSVRNFWASSQIHIRELNQARTKQGATMAWGSWPDQWSQEL